MIKFFRKIRYDLLEKSKTGKYLKYAIGEIILVAIGILIALQVNNWNNKRLAEIEGYEMLTELKDELIGNLAVLTGCVKSLKQDVLAKDRLFKLDDFEDITLDSLRLFINDVNVDVLPNQTIFEKVKIKNISKLTDNLELNTAIFKYFNSMEPYTKSINYFHDAQIRRQRFFYTEQNSIDIIPDVKINGIKELSPVEEKRRLIEFISTTRVTNLIKETYYHEEASTARLDYLKTIMINLLEDIQEELEKGNPTIEPIPQFLLPPARDYTIEQETLKKYVGNYESEAQKMNIQMKDKELYLEIFGVNSYLTPTSKNQFDIKHSIVYRIEFQESEDGQINGFTFIVLNDEHQYIKK